MKTSYRKLYLADQERKFTKQFWKFDLPIMVGVALFIAVALVCAAVPIANEIFKHF